MLVACERTAWKHPAIVVEASRVMLNDSISETRCPAAGYCVHALFVYLFPLLFPSFPSIT